MITGSNMVTEISELIGTIILICMHSMAVKSKTHRETTWQLVFRFGNFPDKVGNLFNVSEKNFGFKFELNLA